MPEKKEEEEEIKNLFKGCSLKLQQELNF